MEKTTEGKFSELFEVIRDYAKREYDYQDKALQVLAGSYTFMFESEDMPDARGVIDEILGDRKSTRLNSSHANISYAVFCLKKKKTYDMLHISTITDLENPL